MSLLDTSEIWGLIETAHECDVSEHKSLTDQASFQLLELFKMQQMEALTTCTICPEWFIVGPGIFELLKGHELRSKAHDAEPYKMIINPGLGNVTVVMSPGLEDYYCFVE
jgi:hypothetical protein